MLVAQCTGSAPCELPTGLPWYFGLLIAVIWLAAVVGAVAVGRHLLQARRARRRSGDHHPRAIERTASPGREIEPW